MATDIITDKELHEMRTARYRDGGRVRRLIARVDAVDRLLKLTGSLTNDELEVLVADYLAKANRTED